MQELRRLGGCVHLRESGFPEAALNPGSRTAPDARLLLKIKATCERTGRWSNDHPFAFDCAIPYNRRWLVSPIEFQLRRWLMRTIGMPELLILLIVIGGGALWIWMIVDCATNEPSGSDKIVWILIVLLGGCIGAAIYLFVRRPKRLEQFGK